MLEKADSKDIIVTSIQYPETSPATLHIAAILAACGVIPQVSQVSKIQLKACFRDLRYWKRKIVFS